MWYAENDVEVQTIATALALNRQSIDRLDLLIVDENRLDELGISVVETAGDTPLTNAQSLHRDLGVFDVDRLAQFASTLFREIHLDNYRRFTKAEIRELLRAARDADRIAMNAVNDFLLPKLEKL